MKTLRPLFIVSALALLQGCATEPVDMVLRPSPEFQPVYPLASDRPKIATGGIYSNRQSDAWFGRGRNYQVGDIITVLLNESTQAARTQNTDVSRESKNSLPSGMSTKVGNMSPFLNGIDLNSNNNSSKGTGKADQQHNQIQATHLVIEPLRQVGEDVGMFQNRNRQQNTNEERQG